MHWSWMGGDESLQPGSQAQCGNVLSGVEGAHLRYFVGDIHTLFGFGQVWMLHLFAWKSR